MVGCSMTPPCAAFMRSIVCGCRRRRRRDAAAAAHRWPNRRPQRCPTTSLCSPATCARTSRGAAAFQCSSCCTPRPRPACVCALAALAGDLTPKACVACVSSCLASLARWALRRDPTHSCSMARTALQLGRATQCCICAAALTLPGACASTALARSRRPLMRAATALCPSA